MAERAAHLADNVLANVPVKQWVLSLPFWLRYKLAWDHQLTKVVLAQYTQALEAFYASRAEQKGLKHAQTGSVTAIQRAGGGLNVNIHFHTSAIDGVFVESKTGELIFYPADPPEDEEIAQLISTIRKNILQLLENRGISIPGDDDSGYDPLADDNPTLANLYSASMAYYIYLGPRAGQKVIRIGYDPYEEYAISRGKGHAHIEGFDLHAGEAIRAGDTERLERLLRYVLRPPVAQDRLKLQEDGRILLELKNPWKNGTTHLLFEPIEFLEKLAAIIPRPQINLIIYSGVLAPNAKWRKRVVNFGQKTITTEKEEQKEAVKPSARSLSWAELMMRVFAIDALSCRHCHGRLRVISVIKESAVIKKILNHLGLPSELPRTSPSRGSPWQEAFEY
jgi:hypothetical protein